MVQLGLKSRSHRVVQDSSVVIQKPNLVTGKVSGDEDERIGCYWNSLPPELLREILLKVDESGSKWPVRKSVVACAGVCRNWRKVMKEIVSTPELSGKLTFPISIKQPGPRDSLLQCFIKRNRSTQMYYLFASCSQALADDGKLLLSARRCKRPTCTDYMIHLHPDGTSKGGDSYIGKLRSNFLGRKFVVYDALPPYSGVKIAKSRSTRPDAYDETAPPKVPMGNYPVAHISYELNVLEARGPRRLQCVMDAIPDSSIRPGGVAPTQTHLPITGNTSPAFPFFRGGSIYFEKSPFRPSTHHTDNKSLFLRNKPPRWHDQFQCWCLNFHGRVTVASVKNFQLVACPGDGEPGPEHEKVILQFGKVGKDVFTMDYRYPISAFQAFAICLSSFDTKIACE